jgi:hypothetical protein
MTGNSSAPILLFEATILKFNLLVDEPASLTGATRKPGML